MPWSNADISPHTAAFEIKNPWYPAFHGFWHEHLTYNPIGDKNSSMLTSQECVDGLEELVQGDKHQSDMDSDAGEMYWDDLSNKASSPDLPLEERSEKSDEEEETKSEQAC